MKSDNKKERRSCLVVSSSGPVDFLTHEYNKQIFDKNENLRSLFSLYLLQNGHVSQSFFYILFWQLTHLTFNQISRMWSCFLNIFKTLKTFFKTLNFILKYFCCKLASRYLITDCSSSDRHHRLPKGRRAWWGCLHHQVW